jgi:hypothetical protein
MMMINKHESLTLLITTALIVVTMLSAALVVSPIQEVDARKTTVKQEQSNKCRDNAFCRNTGSTSITGSETSGVKQKQSNRCSGDATCTNDGTITIGPRSHHPS